MEISVFNVRFFALSSVDGLKNDDDIVESAETNKTKKSPSVCSSTRYSPYLRSINTVPTSGRYCPSSNFFAALFLANQAMC